jgi:glucosamine-6-phosphate deaminase
MYSSAPGRSGASVTIRSSGPVTTVGSTLVTPRPRNARTSRPTSPAVHPSALTSIPAYPLTWTSTSPGRITRSGAPPIAVTAAIRAPSTSTRTARPPASRPSTTPLTAAPSTTGPDRRTLRNDLRESDCPELRPGGCVSRPEPLHTRTAGRLGVRVHPDGEAGTAAGLEAAEALRAVLRERGEARVMFAAAPSQLGTLAVLRAAEGIDWSRVTAFHMDEYVGLPAGAPQRFAAFLHRELVDAVRPRAFHAIDPGPDPAAECARYAVLLAAAPMDLICLGIGENGHLAFNDPPVADFADPLTVKLVDLDDACRRQQVNDGCFPTLTDVPPQAVTVTVPALLSGRRLIATVPGATKRTALRAALDGPLTTACPASALRDHPAATLHTDLAAYGFNA